MVLVIWISISVYSFFPKLYHYLLPVWYLESEILQLAGLILLIISFVWTIIGQYQMSESWRIGIDYNEKTELVSQGLFKYSRNPIFLGVLISYLGTFLIIPNVLSFAMMLLTFITIQFQVRMEEEYLTTVHGKTYLSYQLHVSRWL